MGYECGYIQSTDLAKKEATMDYKRCIFHYELSARLSTSQEGKVILAFDEAGMRPIDVSFSGGYSTSIYIIYKIEGSDDLNIQANSVRFSKKHIEPCLTKCFDTMFGFGMFGRRKVSVNFVKIY